MTLKIHFTRIKINSLFLKESSCRNPRIYTLIIVYVIVYVFCIVNKRRVTKKIDVGFPFRWRDYGLCLCKCKAHSITLDQRPQGFVSENVNAKNLYRRKRIIHAHLSDLFLTIPIIILSWHTELISRSVWFARVIIIENAKRVSNVNFWIINCTVYKIDKTFHGSPE